MRSHPPSTFSPALALPLGILAVSTAAIFIRFAQADAPSLVIAAYRLSLAALFLLPIAVFRYRHIIRSLSRRDLGLALLSGLFLAVHFAAWITSLEYTSVASSVVLVTTTPLWVALLSPFTVKEPLARGAAMGMALALCGGAIVGLSDTCTLTGGRLLCPELGELVRGEAFLGDGLALTGAVMAAAYLIIGRKLRVGLPVVPYITLVYGMAGIALTVTALAAGQSLVGYPAPVYGWFFLLAVVPQLVGHTIFNWALGFVSAALVSVSLLGEPVGSTILAYFLLGEAPSGAKIFGAILILSGIYLASRAEIGQGQAP